MFLFIGIRLSNWRKFYRIFLKRINCTIWKYSFDLHIVIICCYKTDLVFIFVKYVLPTLLMWAEERMSDANWSKLVENGSFKKIVISFTLLIKISTIHSMFTSYRLVLTHKKSSGINKKFLQSSASGLWLVGHDSTPTSLTHASLQNYTNLI